MCVGHDSNRTISLMTLAPCVLVMAHDITGSTGDQGCTGGDHGDDDADIDAGDDDCASRVPGSRETISTFTDFLSFQCFYCCCCFWAWMLICNE